MTSRSHYLPVKRRGTGTGFSLIETMIAMTFLMGVMLVLAQGITIAIGMNINGKNNVQALAIAQRLVEDIQNKYGQTLADYNTLAVTDPNQPTLSSYSGTGGKITGTSASPAYIVTQTVTLDPSATPSYKFVKVSVTPQLRGYGQVQPVSVETYLIKPQS
jgi:Tfp pilus assembly protein PilV